MILFENITILDENFQVAHNMHVKINKDRIEYIGKERPQGIFNYIYNGHGKFLMPGFFNTHSHMPMTKLRGYGEGLPLNEWLFDKIIPFEATLTSDDIKQASTLAIAEMLRFGVVSSTEMYFKCETICQAAVASGFKINISNGITCTDNKKTLESTNEHRENCNVLRDFHLQYNGRIILDAGIHAEYTTTPSIIEQMLQFANDNQLNIHVHLSETEKETEECKARRGMTPTAYMDSLGVFERPTTAAHAVWLTPDDMDILRSKNVTVASCPVSNLKLSSGICKTRQLMDMGVNVSIGTDGAASNNNLNFLEDMKLFALLQCLGNPDIKSVDVIKAATLHGAKSQGRLDSGCLKETYKADLVVFDIDKPHLTPCHSMTSNILYSALGSDVCLTMVDGKILYKDGEYTTIDIEKLLNNKW